MHVKSTCDSVLHLFSFTFCEYHVLFIIFATLDQIMVKIMSGVLFQCTDAVLHLWMGSLWMSTQGSVDLLLPWQWTAIVSYHFVAVAAIFDKKVC